MSTNSIPLLKSLAPSDTDKDTTHSYLEVYQELLGDLYEKAKNVLEIGVQTGGSIILWRDFFKNATIFGIDVGEIPEKLKNDPRMIIFRTNAYSQNFIDINFKNEGIKFDLIIDDGPHTLESMKFFAKYYPQLLTDQGILIIEDVQDISWCDIIKQEFPEDLIKYAYVVDRRHVKNRYDDILLILDKRKILQ